MQTVSVPVFDALAAEQEYSDSPEARAMTQDNWFMGRAAEVL